MICGVGFYDVEFQREEGKRSKHMDFCQGVTYLDNGKLLI